ncbi:MAG TPA: Asp-tRNA(Asn)/Glu-tRNA(Gln) amidotransferase subunit GatC [Gammaproteobacteria bacterium]|nr:Asp-tRNA(Asn)/Glu-tRNA(Gln) amidotransferase subunit GatC [Gammaproteobacteria bacterium]
MALKLEDIEKLGELARLRIEPGEVYDLMAKLTSILAFVDQLQAADTSEVTPMAHPLDRAQRLRPDVVTEPDQHELYQQNAPRVERGLYLVPKVLE